MFINLRKINNLSINFYELYFHQDQKRWKHNLIPVEVSKNETDRVVDLIKYKNHYALIIKLHVFSGNNNKTFICKR